MMQHSKDHQAIFCLVALLAMAVSAYTQSASAKEPTGSISGKATIDGKPAANLTISLQTDWQMGLKQPIDLSSKTDAEGHFQLLHVPAGKFFVAAFAPGCYSESTQSNRWSKGTAITVDEGENVSDVNITLRRGGVITGRITDAVGRPLIEEQVHLGCATPSGEKEDCTPSRGLLQTDDRGVYRAYGLPLGHYTVSAGTPSSKDSLRMGMGNRFFAQTYYPGVSDAAKATEVEVTEGGEAANIDIALG